MINHSKSVKQGITKSLMVVYMPYQTYRNKSEALKNAKKIAKDTKCDAVKLEGGTKIIPIIEHLIQNNINVMGHIGILPQSVKGKFKVKGKNLREQNQLMKDAKALEQAGVFSIVLEGIKSAVAKKITSNIEIPTIGIGASNDCDGQVLVTDDLLGLTNSNIKFVKKYADLGKSIQSAVKSFRKEVINKKFPSKKYSY
jgi:3-methyl-2-oxobutanoate hydroxymethyltransferase